MFTHGSLVDPKVIRNFLDRLARIDEQLANLPRSGRKIGRQERQAFCPGNGAGRDICKVLAGGFGKRTSPAHRPF